MPFVEAERTRLWLRCALFGPSGSGKTMTALRIAKGIADRAGSGIAVIDTEARSASKYADRFRFQVDNLKNRSIDGYLVSMRECVAARYQVLVIDSLSHAWHELLQEVDQLAYNKFNGNSNAAWSVGTPKQKKLIEAIINFPAHLIVTMRSKTEWVMDRDEKGKTKPVNMGLAPEQGKGVEYEFDLLVRLDQKHQATVTKDRTGKFQDEVIEKPGEDFGVALYDWLNSGNAEAPSPVFPALTGIGENTKLEYPAEKPEPPKQAIATAVKNEPAQPLSTVKQPDMKTQGEAVINEIGVILNTADPDGNLFFNEGERADARQIVVSVKADEAGVRELRSFRDFLSGELTKRETIRKAA